MRVLVVLLMTCALLSGVSIVGAEGPDMVVLNDGSVVHGEIVELMKGDLKIKTTFGVGDVVTVKWSTVEKLILRRPLPIHLKDGTVFVATLEEGPPGSVLFHAEPMMGTLTIPLEGITAINPLVQPPVVYVGSVTMGLSQTTGNTHLRNGSFVGDFSGRSESLRLTILGRYVYGDDRGNLITRNSRGTIKLDFFVTKRFYWFTSAFFEQDTFQDLKLRTALATGPGYQFIEKGDLSHPWLKDMTLYAEAGLAYFNEDFMVADDRTTTRMRWSLKLNWPIVDERLTFFHFIEAFPSVQNTQDFYLTVDTGLRVKIYESFVSNFQLVTRYNNRPPPGVISTDNMYLWTIGYSFDTSRKRT